MIAKKQSWRFGIPRHIVFDVERKRPQAGAQRGHQYKHAKRRKQDLQSSIRRLNCLRQISSRLLIFCSLLRGCSQAIFANVCKGAGILATIYSVDR